MKFQITKNCTAYIGQYTAPRYLSQGQVVEIADSDALALSDFASLVASGLATAYVPEADTEAPKVAVKTVKK